MSFSRYPAYKDSGVTWLGEVPTSSWQVTPFKRFAKLTYGDALPTEVRSEEGSTKVYGSNGPVGVHERSNTSGPVVVIGRKGSFGALNWSEYPAFVIDTAYFLDKSCVSCDLRWLFWTLHSANLSAYSQDTGVPGLARELVHNMFFPVPDLSTQSAIASFLDRETAKTDVLVAEQERLIRLLKEKRQCVISRAVTKGLASDVPMRDSGVEWIGQVPNHWDVMPLMRLTDPERPIMYGIVLPGPDVQEGVPIVKGGNVRPSRLNLQSLARTTPDIEAPYARARLRAGDLIYSIRGSIGDCEVVPAELHGANITQDVARVAPRSGVDFEWLRYALLSSPLQEALACRSLGAAVRGINIFDLKRVQVPTPPDRERRRIAIHITSELRKIEALSIEAQKGIILLKERRSALISAAVTGKIDVRGRAPVIQVEAA